ncbi:MAG: hypothetical protein ABIL09_11175 [Gemmatimonadota bacterium]
MTWLTTIWTKLRVQLLGLVTLVAAFTGIGYVIERRRRLTAETRAAAAEQVARIEESRRLASETAAERHRLVLDARDAELARLAEERAGELERIEHIRDDLDDSTAADAWEAAFERGGDDGP